MIGIQTMRVAPAAMAMGLVLASSGQAWGWGKDVFGQGEVEGFANVKRTLDTSGFQGLGAEDFPRFQNFLLRKDGLSGPILRNASFGMVYRSWKHILARRSGVADTSEHARHVSTEHPLGWYSQEGVGGAAAEAKLRFLVANDASDAPSSSAFAHAADFVDTLERRLRSKETRELFLSIRSPNGTRRRNILVYQSKRTEKSEKGQVWWSCKFYAPHIGDAGTRILAHEGELRIRTGDTPGMADDLDPWADNLEIQVSAGWIEQTRRAAPEAEAFSTQGIEEIVERRHAERTAEGDIRVHETRGPETTWYRLEREQLLTAESQVDVLVQWAPEKDRTILEKLSNMEHRLDGANDWISRDVGGYAFDTGAHDAVETYPQLD